MAVGYGDVLMSCHVDSALLGKGMQIIVNPIYSLFYIINH